MLISYCIRPPAELTFFCNLQSDNSKFIAELHWFILKNFIKLTLWSLVIKYFRLFGEEAALRSFAHCSTKGATDRDSSPTLSRPLRPMTHAPETGAINRPHFLAPVSGTCVMQIWDRIRLVPDSGAD